MTDAQKALLSLIKKSLGFKGEISFDGVSVRELIDEARSQAVTALAYDATHNENLELSPQAENFWRQKAITATIHNENNLILQNEIDAEFNKSGILYAVLKGASIARLYPKPELRSQGDIDLLIKEEALPSATEIIKNMGFELLHDEHDHQLSFLKGKQNIELHRKINGIPKKDKMANEYLTALFEKAAENAERASIGEYSFSVCQPVLQGVTLYLHTRRHFYSEGIGLRHLCDWAVYCESSFDAKIIEELTEIFSKCNMLKFAKVLTKTCILYLGVQNPYAVEFSLGEDIADGLCEKIMEDVFISGNMGRKSREAKYAGKLIENQNKGNIFKRYMNFSYYAWGITRKYPVLAIFTPFCIGGRFIFRVISGKRCFKDIKGAVNLAKEREKLYKDLEIAYED